MMLRRCRLTFAAAIVFLAVTCLPPHSARALDSSDLLFHLSFDSGTRADFSRGSSTPAAGKDSSIHRSVEGVVGEGYLFGGQGSGLVFPVDNDGTAIARQQYGSTVNLLGAGGSIAFWYKPLANESNQHHDFVRFDGGGIYRDHWGVFMFRCGGKELQIYNSKTPIDQWMHFVVTWRKGELRSYLNGRLWGVASGAGAVETPPASVSIADEGKITAPHCAPGSIDDAVIDEVQIFSRPLAAEEVRSVFERTGAAGYRTDTQFARGADAIARPAPVHAIASSVRQAPIEIDGALTDWKGIPSHGGLIETRLGVLDDDDTRIAIANDDARLYLSFVSGVDESRHADPVQIRYPTGIFESSPRDRDGDVYADDYIEFIIQAGGRAYRLAVNPHGALHDDRDGDAAWNADAQIRSRHELSHWSGELSIELAAMGIKPTDTIQFNVIRSWKRYKSAMNSLFVDSASRPQCAPLILGAAVSASVRTLGKPWEGAVAIEGDIIAPPGTYELHVTGKGHDVEFADAKKIDVAGGSASAFSYARPLEKSADLSLIVEARDAGGHAVYKRTIPFVYVAAARTELANYPGWGRLGVTVTPLHREQATAEISLLKDGQPVREQMIDAFPEPAASVVFDLNELSAGPYEVLTRLRVAGRVVHEERLPYQKNALPDWYESQAGISDVPPPPWTHMRVEGNSAMMLIKQFDFDRTLFPSHIVSNGQSLLAEPIRIRIKRNGEERILRNATFEFTERTARRVNWRSTARDGALNVKVQGWIEFDGFTWFDMTLQGGVVDEVSLEIPLAKTSATLTATGLLGEKPIQNEGCGAWIGSEKAGFQYWWEDQRNWVLGGKPNSVTPGQSNVLIEIPIIQSRTALPRPRTVTLGWAVTPSKPLPANRWATRAKGITYSNAYYATARPNYPGPMPGETAESIAQSLDTQRKLQNASIVLWYAFGPFMWIGAPEYAEWWREWRVTSWPEVPPNPSSNEWGWACHKSSGSNLFLHKLDAFMRDYPQQGVYVDCYFLMPCDNEAHGCGWVDEKGVRHASIPLLATRRHYERLYTIIKTRQPVDGWLRIHDWGPIMPVAAFCDENWVGEGLIGPIASTPEKNYYPVVDLAYARTALGSANWGHLTNWLTELGVYAGTDPIKRAQWYGKMIKPPADGQRGDWIIPRMKDYEHVAGLVLASDIWNFGGNDLGITKALLDQMFKDIGMDDSVRFIGHWEITDELTIAGGEPEKVVCSIYFKPPAGAQANAQSSWLMLVPFNNTDSDVTVHLKPNLAKFGLESKMNGQFRDVYKAVNYEYEGTSRINPDDAEPPHFQFKGVDERFDLKDGQATIDMPRRSFKALLLEK